MQKTWVTTELLWAFYDDLLQQGRIDEALTVLDLHPEMLSDPDIENFDDGISDEEALKKFYKYVEELDSRKK